MTKEIKKVIKRSEIKSAEKALELNALAEKNIDEKDLKSMRSHAAKQWVETTKPFVDEAKEILEGVNNGEYQVEEDVKEDESSEVAVVEVQSKPAVSQVASSEIKKIETFITVRQAFIEKVNEICVEGKDYHIINGKKSLAKGGAEKIASIFKWNASFIKDTQALEMLGDIPGLVAFKCELHAGDKFVGEGRGAALLSKNAGDPNKTLKMAQKSAFIDAVLRASGLSDFFTQDLEDMPRDQIGKTPASSEPRPASDKQKAYIMALCKQKGITKSGLEELMQEYKTPHDLIEYLKKA